MKLVKVEKQYTLEFTEKQLKLLLATIAGSTVHSVKTKLYDEGFSKEFGTSEYEAEDAEYCYIIFNQICKALEV